MIVIIGDTTEYESQDNELAEMAVREVKGVARSVRVALSELYNKDISSKHLVLPWLVSYAAGQVTRGQIGADGLTPHLRLKGRAFRKLLPVFVESVLYLPIGKRASRLPERWSDALFLGRREELGILRWHRACCRASSKSGMETIGRKSERGAPLQARPGCDSGTDQDFGKTDCRRR